MRGVAVLLAAAAFGSTMGLATAAEGEPARDQPAVKAPLPGEYLRDARAKPGVAEDRRGNPYVAGELIVTYEEGASASAERRAVSEVGAEVDEELPEIDAEVLSVPAVKGGQLPEARQTEALERRKQELEGNPSVESVSYNYLAEAKAAPDDPLFPLQWNLRRIRAPQSWDNAGGRGSVIAVLDSGIDNSHPDTGRIVGERDYVSDDPSAQDDNGHGTHVAGIAAARTNNSKGIAGVSPAGALFDYKVLGADGSGAFGDITEAILDATDNGAEVINLSLGASVDVPAVENAVNYAWNKGAVVVAAAGNEFEVGNPTTFPAAYARVIAVGAISADGARSSFSNTGGYLDVAAPGGSGSLGAPAGENILSTVPPFVDEDGYASFAGTSMATPHVAGLAANLASMGYTAAQVRRRIETTATDLGSAGRDDEYGRGLINARAATRDARPPRGTIRVNGGAAETGSRAVKLSLRASDPVPTTGVAAMRFSRDGRSWTRWRPYAGRRTWRLSGGPGIKTVYVQYRDRAGNVSAAARDGIRYSPARR